MKNKIAVIGLGYVGIPLLNELSKHFVVSGYDINKLKINNLKKNPYLNELNNKKISNFKNINYFDKIDNLRDSKIFIICVPTPVKKNNTPDFESIIEVSKKLSRIIKHKDIIIFESTFYPYTTKEIIIPIFEKYSSLKCATKITDLNNKNKKYFSLGYSPERINPGDKKHTINKIIKIVSASNNVALNQIYNIYNKIISAGVYKVSSIEVAEGSKVIENIQRDINIALTNELKIIFDKLKINFNDVLNAASTKWNYTKFKPGMVGGHCISVDPYYLAFKAKTLGYNPKILLAGREINNNMFRYYANYVLRLIKKKYNKDKKIKILIMGFSYKPDVSDFRNTQVIKFYNFIKKTYKNVSIFDPLVDKKEVKKTYKINLINKPIKKYYDTVIILVNHKIFKKNNEYFYKKYCKVEGFFYKINL